MAPCKDATTEEVPVTADAGVSNPRISAMMRDLNPPSELLSELRKVDVDGDGMITNEELLHYLERTTKDAKGHKRTARGLTYALIALVFVAAANFLTAYFAVQLAKDTDVNSRGLLISKDTGAAIHTVGSKPVIDLSEYSNYTEKRQNLQICSNSSSEAKNLDPQMAQGLFGSDLDEALNMCRDGFGSLSLLYKVPRSLVDNTINGLVRDGIANYICVEACCETFAGTFDTADFDVSEMQCHSLDNNGGMACIAQSRFKQMEGELLFMCGAEHWMCDVYNYAGLKARRSRDLLVGSVDFEGDWRNLAERRLLAKCADPC